MKIYWKLFIAFWLVSFLLSSSALFLGKMVGQREGKQPAVPQRQLAGELGALLRQGQHEDIAQWAQRREAAYDGELFIWHNRTRLVYPASPDQRADIIRDKLVQQGNRGQLREFGGHYKYRLVRLPRGEQYEILTRLPPPWLQRLREYLGLRLLLALAVSGLVCFFLARLFTRRIEALSDVVKEFADGRVSVRAEASPRGGDEIEGLARDVNRMASRTESLLEAQQRLLGDVSHELRSPLARLELALALARKDGDNGAAFEQMSRDLQRLDEIIADLLLLPRLESQKIALADSVDLVGLIDEVVADCTIEAQASGKQIHWHCLVEESHIQCNHSLLRSALENIIRNALAYTPEDTAIDVELLATASQRMVSVRDYGPGVPAADLGRIFEPFYRVERDRNRRHGGTGLGLAIADRAIRLHGGSIKVANKIPGLEVCLLLPPGDDLQ